MTTASSAAAVVVLDTNVCLDLFVFDDRNVLPLRAGLQSGTLVAATDEACREEWLRVLEYPQLGLSVEQRAQAIAAFDAAMIHLPRPTAAVDLTTLPRCRDPDDQKFLELAMRANAGWLLSRDDHLLALARRTARAGLFEILTPTAWAQRTS